MPERAVEPLLACLIVGNDYIFISTNPSKSLFASLEFKLSKQHLMVTI